MSAGGVLTRWPVASTIQVPAEQTGADGRIAAATLTNWLNQAQSAYLDRLPSGLRSGLTSTAVHIVQRGPLSTPSAVTVAISVVELRELTFDMQVRVREEGTGSIVASGGCTVAMIDRQTGQKVALPAELRQALVRVEKEAAFYC